MAWVVPFIPYIAAAAGAVIQGRNANNQAKSVAEMSDRSATATRQAALADEETQRRQNAMAMGDVRASAASSGFDPSTGSLADLQARTAGEMELEALTTRYKGELQAIGMNYEAATTRQAGRTAQSNGYLSAAATLAGGYGRRNYLDASRIPAAQPRVSSSTSPRDY